MAGDALGGARRRNLALALALADDDEMAPGPASGVTLPRVFGDKGGPGLWIDDEEGAVEVRFADLAVAPCCVLRLSPTALWWVPNPGEEAPPAGETRVSLHGRRRDVPLLSARVAPRPGRSPVIGASFVDLPPAATQAVVALLRDLLQAGGAMLAHRPPVIKEDIVERERIAAVVGALAGVGPHGFLRADSASLPVHLESVDEDGYVQWTGPPSFSGGACVVDLTGYNSIYRLYLASARRDGDRVTTPLPTLVERVRHRRLRRTDTPLQMDVSFRSPLVPDRPPVRREVRDLSFAGLCFATSPDDDLLVPGMPLALVEVRDVRDDGGELVRVRCEVRSISEATADGTSAHAHVSVIPCSKRDELGWNRLVARVLYPTTEIGARWTEPVWELLETSGYLNLSGKTPAQFALMKTSFVDASAKSAGAPALFCNAVFPSERGVEATLSMVKPYEGTWWGHQLAKRQVPKGSALDARRVLRDIYLRAMEHPQADPDFRWMTGCIEATVPWMRRSHIDFARRHEPSGAALVLPFQLMEATCVGAGDLDGVREAEYEVDEATRAELGQLCAVIRDTRPPAYVECMDFVPARLDLLRVSQLWHRAGFERQRAVMVAHRAGIAVAAAVLETGDAGTSLFRLLDNVRIFALEPGGDAAFGALLDEARRFYAARDKPSFMYLCEHGDTAHARAAGLRDLGEGFVWIISASILPEFLEHVFEVSAPTTRRSAATSKGQLG